MEELKRYFPEDIEVVYPYDTTPFTRVAIHEVVKTLYEAVILVFVVMLIFLGSFRATIIPTIAVPVVVLGTFGIIWILGYSINMLTMFALVLSIGLLVDDAIIVVENVDRIMEEEGLSPKEATEKSMEQITSALIGIGVILAAVFLPMAFFPGSTGIIYRQFSVTIASSMLLSVLVALILTPVLCASILKPESTKKRMFLLRPFLNLFNKGFSKLRNTYIAVVAHVLGKKLRYVFLYIILVGIMGYFIVHLPTSYLPNEDQGLMFVQAILPSGTPLEKTYKVMKQVEDYFLNKEKDTVKSFGYVIGYSFGGEAQNVALGFVHLRDWKERTHNWQRVWALQKRAMASFMQIKNAMVFAFPPPAIIELGRTSGFDFELLDFGGVGHKKLMEARNMLLMMAAKNPKLIRVRPNGMDDVPEYKIDVDWDKAGALGVPISSVYTNIAASFGGYYVNDFVRKGRVKRVYVQYDAPFRMRPVDLTHIYVRNKDGKMVPFSAIAKGHWIYGAARLERYNGFPSINIWGEPAPGVSSGEAMKEMEKLASKLPKGIGYDWTGLSFQEKMATAQAPLVFGFSVFVIFLALAALYNSWSVPLTNLIILPLGVIGAAIATYARGLFNDVYFQIGFVTTMGLATKNAILIIQFIRDNLTKGRPLIESYLEGTKIRFRPIMMTSFAFFVGVLPLALSKGAGSGAMNSIGTSVCGGMLSSTFFIFFIPLFFVIIYKLGGKEHKKLNT